MLFLSLFPNSCKIPADNGVVSLNLPHSAQNIGTLLSRSTNPKFIFLMNQFSQLIWEETSPKLVNRLIWYTKADLIKELQQVDKQGLVALTTSCASTRGIDKTKPFCGVCSQCIDRRFAVEYCGLNDDEEPRFSYKVDIFRDDLSRNEAKGIGKTHAENYYRKAHFINKTDDNGFMAHFPTLLDFIPDEEDTISFLQKAFELHTRWSKQTLYTVGSFWAEYQKGEFPEHSFISMIFRESNQKANHLLNEYKLPRRDRKLLINTISREVLYEGVRIDEHLTSHQFDCLLKVAKNPRQVFEFIQFAEDSEADFKAGQKQKSLIDICFREALLAAGKEISKGFSIFKLSRSIGYCLRADLENEVEVIDEC